MKTEPLTAQQIIDGYSATDNRYARIENGTHWTEGCGSERPQVLRWSVRYQSRAGECCEWYPTESEAQARLAQVRKLITI